MLTSSRKIVLSKRCINVMRRCFDVSCLPGSWFSINYRTDTLMIKNIVNINIIYNNRENDKKQHFSSDFLYGILPEPILLKRA